MVVTTRAGRHRRIVEILGSVPVRSQGQLLELLAADGFDVTQATLSRDLVDLGAVKVRTAKGSVYAVPGEGGDRSLQSAQAADLLDAKLQRLLEELLVSATSSGMTF